MHLYHAPENIDDIVNAIEEYFIKADNRKNAANNRFHLVEFNYESFRNWLESFLKGIKAFKQLNISKKLKNEGVDDADDVKNKGIRIITRETTFDYESRYIDFVDLDACIQNIYTQVLNLHEIEDDCFLCKYAKDYGSMEPGDERCNTCLCNPKISYKREPHPLSLKPRKDWTEEEKQLYGLD